MSPRAPLAATLPVLIGLCLGGCTSPRASGTAAGASQPGSTLRPRRVDEWAFEMAPDRPLQSSSLQRRDACFPKNYEVCRNGLDDDCNGVVDEGCGMPSGVVQFIAAWDDADIDVDLDVIDPSGELIEAGRVSEGGLFKEADCPLRDGPCPDGNLENVFLEGDHAPKKGVYRVRIRLETVRGVGGVVGVRFSARMANQLSSYDLTLSEQEPEISLTLTLQ